ncbi:MAG: hypothetical protein FJ100_17750 [Deltaproteobacteria bacterium]|nr:hypothetical protein [Deltaproteobacteria bacterium]
MSATHADSHAHSLDGPVPFSMPGGARNLAIGLLVLGAVLLGAGAATAGEHGAWRVFADLLIAAFFYTSLAVGGGVILAIMHVTRSGWSAVVRRIPEAVITWLPMALVTMLVVGGLGMHHLYEWSHPDIVAGDHLLRHKSVLLNPTWYYAATVVIIGAWVAFTFKMRANSIAQDGDGSEGHTGRNMVLSVVFLIFFGLSMTAGSLFWLMSLEPHWFSTMFGVYQFAGAHKAAAAVCAILLVMLIGSGQLKQANANHLHDFGKMIFAYSTFWAYIWVSQFLLIWYANIPEETGYFILRQDGGWMALFGLNVILNWVIPFFTLLPRPNKRNPKVLVPVAIVTLIGLWLDVYLQVMPAASHFAAHHHKLDLHGVVFGPGEIGATLLLGGGFVLVVLKMLGRASLVPLKDPYLQESLHHQQ